MRSTSCGPRCLSRLVWWRSNAVPTSRVRFWGRLTGFYEWYIKWTASWISQDTYMHAWAQVTSRCSRIALGNTHFLLLAKMVDNNENKSVNGLWSVVWLFDSCHRIREKSTLLTSSATSRLPLSRYRVQTTNRQPGRTMLLDILISC